MSIKPGVLWGAALLCLLMAFFWFSFAKEGQNSADRQPISVDTLQSGTVAAMHSPLFHYSKGWRVTLDGADPTEPPDPWIEPAGILTFTYQGAELAAQLAIGDFWGYLFVTVDGRPANLLPVIPGNYNSHHQAAGYRTLYAPERQLPNGSSATWVRLQRAPDSQRAANSHNADPQKIHLVEIEVWRSWGQMPLRAIAVDALPPEPQPSWPGMAALVVAFWCVAFALQHNKPALKKRGQFITALFPKQVRQLLIPVWGKPVASILAAGGVVIVALGVILQQWPLTLVGLALVGWAGLQRPALWLAALLFALPFYFSFPLPLLPSRALSLIDIGILGGLALTLLHTLLDIHLQKSSDPYTTPDKSKIQNPKSKIQNPILYLALIVSWSLIAASAADQFGLALREWRTVFLTAGLFVWLVQRTLAQSQTPAADVDLLFGAWIAGGVTMALIGLVQYSTGVMVINAEGVQRVRAFYGSPNNLALYLERALAPTLALALFAPWSSKRVWWAGLALVQTVALLLTFSKGAILLGLPAMLVTLWIGGLVLLKAQGKSRRTLWWIAGIGLAALLTLAPFLGTERFQRLLDLQQGTGFLRLQLWRSAWQMALDHLWLGVGPDNFLYAYRSWYLLPAAWQEPNLNHPHNWLLDWWTRLGLPGLALALGFFTTLLIQLWQNLRRGLQPIMSLGLLAATVAALAHGLIDASYALPDVMIVWALMACLAATVKG